MDPIGRIFTIKQFAARNPCFTEGSLRWLIFRGSDNGLATSGAILRIGRRVLIDEPAFIAWIRAQQGGS